MNWRDPEKPRVLRKPGDFRPGKTQRDHRSGAWAQTIANNQARGDRDAGRKPTK